jgi:hypothetical protein
MNFYLTNVKLFAKLKVLKRKTQPPMKPSLYGADIELLSSALYAYKYTLQGLAQQGKLAPRGAKHLAEVDDVLRRIVTAPVAA